MSETIKYDVAIAGGGLAGLSFAIQMAKQGYKVILFEKEKYPFHRVCGEYISLESWDFLESLGVDLHSLKVSTIKKLQVSAENGKILHQDLPLGGFGISRYKLDHELAKLAIQAGAEIREECTVNDIRYVENGFEILTSLGSFRSTLTVGTHGKRSRLDIKWNRPFILAKKNKLNNYIGVKYHVRSTFWTHTIALHIFKQGYCGLVKVEDDKYCLCYLSTAANLQECGGDIHKMEEKILSRNPHLKKIFNESEKIFDPPVVISQISYDKKTLVEDHVLMTGDAAGMITPLCGNGMSMALHGSKLLASQADLFLQGKITREELEKQYQRQWKRAFAKRLWIGRNIQRIFGNKWMTNSLIRIGKIFPRITKLLISQTHGQPF